MIGPINDPRGENSSDSNKNSQHKSKAAGVTESAASLQSTSTENSKTSHGHSFSSLTSSPQVVSTVAESAGQGKEKTVDSPQTTETTNTNLTIVVDKPTDESVCKGDTAMDTASVSSSGLNTQGHQSSNLDHEKDKDASKDKELSSKEGGGTGSSTAPKEKEKPVRVTRSSQRILKEGGGTHTPNSPSSSSPKTSACPSPSHSHQTDSQGSAEVVSSVVKQAASEGTEKMDTGEAVELHPRKRKIRSKDLNKDTKEKDTNKEKEKEAPAPSTSAAAVPAPAAATSHTPSTSAAVPPPAEAAEQQQGTSTASNDQPMLNCFEMYLNIRKQIDRRRRNLFPVTPKPPKGFKDYLMNRGTYVLAGNANALAVPLLNPPPSLVQQMKDFFSDQEKERHKLRLQHLVEKEKLVLSVEQEILRVHGRAARALSNQTLPFSVCTILKDQEVYNLLTPEQEEKDINARSRYNGRLFLSWLQDVDDKWDKIKEYMLLRHHNEAESLHAVQKMDWEWKLKELGLCEPKATPLIEDMSVPMVHVSDDFDLLPA